MAASPSVLLPLAVALDFALGDPPSWPHPVRVIGAVAARCEAVSRRALSREILAGGLCWAVVMAVTVGVAWGALALAGALHPLAGDAVALYFLYAGVAARDLGRHATRVYRALEAGNLPLARREVSMIVGRDTDGLDASGVARACVESVAENIVDGVGAPLFWAAVFGPLGVMGYKAVNTMDSMFGYTNSRYIRFGRVAARADDAANWLPARLTAARTAF